MMKKYIILLGLILVFLAGCNKSNVEPVFEDEDTVNQEPVVVEKEITVEEQEQVLKDYYDLLKLDSENLIEFINDNIAKLNTSYVDQIIISFEDHLKQKNTSVIDIINKLEKYGDYSSDEVKSYLNILREEGKAFFTDGEMINISLEEILNRAASSEKHLRDFSDGETYRRVYEYYNAYITGAILGAGNQYIYANEGDSTIKDEVLNLYKSYIDANKDSFTSNILTRYIEELELDNMDLNGPNVIKFYDNLDDIIRFNARQ